MMGNPIHNPGASYSRYSSGVITPHESVGYEASNEPSLYSGSYGYARIDSKLPTAGDEFDYMDDDPGGLQRPPGSHGSMNPSSYPAGLYGMGQVVRGGPHQLMYSSESIGSANDSPIDQPETGIYDNQPETGIYEDESIFDPPPPAPTSKPKDKTPGNTKKNKFFKNYYDKASLNQIISSSSKVSNRSVTNNIANWLLASTGGRLLGVEELRSMLRKLVRNGEGCGTNK